jgi:hypothetical protein
MAMTSLTRCATEATASLPSTVIVRACAIPDLLCVCWESNHRSEAQNNIPLP